MRRKFLKSGVSLLVCLALLFSMAATSAFAKAAEEDTHNYQLRSGDYMGDDIQKLDESGIEFRFLGDHELLVIYGSYDYGFLTYTYDGYTSSGFGRPGGSGVFPIETSTLYPGAILEVTIQLSSYDGSDSCEVTRTFVYGENGWM